MKKSTDIESASSSQGGKKVVDIEKNAATKVNPDDRFEASDSKPLPGLRGFLYKAALGTGLEVRGVTPVPLSERTVTQYFNVFSIWFCISVSLLPITFGILGTLSFGLSLRDASLVIIFITLFCTTAPAFLSTLGPKTGMRQMIQARFSFGRYLVSIPVLLNLATLTGFCVIMCVVGGQTLSAVSGDTMTPSVGIAIIAVLALLVSFCGFNVLHAYERYAWIPALIAMVIATGCGGKNLKKQTVLEEPASPATIVSYVGVVASYMIPWAALASDFTTYISPQAPSWRIGLYSYLGLALPTIFLMILGAAIGGAVPNVESWNAGYESTNVGGVFDAMLSPAKGFGKFITVVLAFTLLGNMAATMYSITLNFQMMVPWLVRVPRYVFAIVITAIVIPVSIRAATDFFVNLENFVALIGYWSASFIAIVVVEHFVFRKTDTEAYDHDAWNVASKLPSGVAAIGAAVLSLGLVIPGMSQVWYTGPIAETTGDIGFEFAFVVGALLYVPLRLVEKKLLGR